MLSLNGKLIEKGKVSLVKVLFFIASLGILLIGCTHPTNHNKKLVLSINSNKSCLDIKRIGGQICGFVTANPSFPSDDINIYYIPPEQGDMVLIISQSDLGSMYSDIRLFNDARWLAYGTSEEGHLVYALYDVDELITQGTIVAPKFVLGEYGLIDVIDITDDGRVLYEIDFHMKRPSIKCVTNSPPDQCFVEERFE